MAETIITICTTRLNEMLSQELHPLRGAEDGIRSLIKALKRRSSFIKSIDDRGDDRTHTMKQVKDLITACNEGEIAIEKYLLKRKQRGGKVMGCCFDHVGIGSLLIWRSK
ncbi:hypothetical protein QJS10_CPA05g02125 [Acorus calamus]|uniref:Uncharacterized protein n=1 Tax=Acorus calamus TaxID=4465 RepID=A0AAV9EUD8_ACOCL|nr:hypothetical protein QJS10_CPA05g02125 [Acorus calamus]